MKVVINPAYSFLSDFINNLPDYFESEGEVIYEGRNTIKQYSIKNIDIAVKSFKVPLLVNRLAYTYFRKSKAARSYHYAFEIKRRGFLTPDPIAYVETYKVGLLKRSYFVSVYDSASETVRSLMAGENVPDAENKLRSFASFTAALHEAGIYHVDYSPGNVLIKNLSDSTYSFSLIDINRMQFKQVSKKDAYVNFARLSFSPSALSAIAKQYALCRGWDVNETDCNMTSQSDAYFKNYAYRLACKSWRKTGGSLWNNPVWKYKMYLLLRRLPFISSSSREKLLLLGRKIYDEHIAPFDFRSVLLSKYY